MSPSTQNNGPEEEDAWLLYSYRVTGGLGLWSEHTEPRRTIVSSGPGLHLACVAFLKDELRRRYFLDDSARLTRHSEETPQG